MTSVIDGPVLPLDYGLLFLTKIDGRVNLTATKEFQGVVFSIKQGRNETLIKGRDAVTGMRGRGLNIEQKSTGGPGTRRGGAIRLTFFWEPEPFTCYRDGKLIGIWDPNVQKLRKANPGEASSLLRVLP